MFGVSEGPSQQVKIASPPQNADRNQMSPTRPSLSLGEAQMLRVLEAADQAAGPIPEVRTQRAQQIDAVLQAYVKKNGEGVAAHDSQAHAARLTDAYSFFTTRDESFRMTPAERIASIFETLDVPTEPQEKAQFDEALSQFMTELAERAFDQHLENPQQYVSHGFDHSIRAANYIAKITENFPGILENIIREYKISEGQALFILQTAALFHDCGYCKLAESSSKVSHSMGSLRVIGNKHLQQNIRQLLGQGDTPSQQDNLSTMFNDLEGAILFHNADKVESRYTAKLHTTQGEYMFLADEDTILRVIRYFELLADNNHGFESFRPATIIIRVKSEEAQKRIEATLREVFRARGIDEMEIPKVFLDKPETSTPLSDDLLYPGREIDLEPGDKAVGLEYKPADTLGYSLLAALRIADNMDILPDRFSAIQRLPEFMQICREFYEMGEVSPDAKEEIIRRVINKSGQLDHAQAKKLLEVGMLLDSETYKHFGGCEALRAVTFRPIPEDPERAEIVVHVDRKIFEERLGQRFKEKIIGKDGVEEIDISIAEYQIWRLEEAIKANLHKNERIRIRIFDQDGVEMTDSTFLKKE